MQPQHEAPVPASSGPAVPAPLPTTQPRVLSILLLVALVGLALLAAGGALWIRNTEYFWRSPIAEARFQIVTDFDGIAEAAAVSRDGQFVAFLSDRDGPMDVWVTQVGSGQFHNLTRGSAPQLVNPSIRTVGFSPDSSLVTFWVRKRAGSSDSDIGVWAVPTLGGQPRPYLEGVAEFDWSHDGSRLAYHTPGPGDPLFVSDGDTRSERGLFSLRRPGCTRTFLCGPRHSVHLLRLGSLPDKLDVWRTHSTGGSPERITSLNTRVSHPVLLNRRTLMYLASDPDGSGPWLYSMDVERRISHRLLSSSDRYTSLAASADGNRLVVTHTSPKTTLWRLRIGDSPKDLSPASPISLTTSTGFSPRLGTNYLLYVSATGASESIWKLANGTPTELWRGEGRAHFRRPRNFPGRTIHRILGPPERTHTLVRNAGRRHQCSCGCHRRLTCRALLRGLQTANPLLRRPLISGVPHLFRIPLDGRSSCSDCSGVFGRSRVGARRRFHRLLRTRHRHHVFGKSSHARLRNPIRFQPLR